MATKKKTVKVPAGIYLKGTPGNISVHIHASNGNRLAVLKGYNTRQNVQKGLSALFAVLKFNDAPGDAWAVIDLVKPRKPAPKPKK